MANEIILTTRAELEEIITSSLRAMLPELVAPPAEPTHTWAERLSAEEAAEYLNERGYKTSTNTLYKLSSRGEIPSEKYGKYLMFATSDLIAYAEGKTRRQRTKADAMREAEEEIRKSARRRA